MSDPISEWLDEVQARIDAATPGPLVAVDLDAEINGETITGAEHGWWWVWQESKKPYYGGVIEAEGVFTVQATDGRIYQAAGAVGEGVVDDGTTPQARKDVEFFAAARTDLPRAVEALRKVMAVCDDLEADARSHEVFYDQRNQGVAEAERVSAKGVRRAIIEALGLEP